MMIFLHGWPMRAACPDLTIKHLSGAHWLPVERKTELIAVIHDWVRTKAL